MTPGRRREDALQVLLGLADVLVDHGGEVDDVQLQVEVVRDHLGGHRLAGARVAGEQGGDPDAATAAGPHPPVSEHLLPVPGPQRDLLQGGEDGGRQHQVGPADARLDPAGEPLQRGPVLRARAEAEVPGADPVVRLEHRLHPCGLRGARDLLRPEPELRGRLERVGLGDGPREREPPDRLALLGGARRHLHEERRGGRPQRVPRDLADEQQRPRIGDQLLEQVGALLHRRDRTGHDPGAGEPGLADREPRHPGRVGLPDQVVEVDDQRSVAGEPQRLDREHPARAGGRLAEVGEGHAVPERRGQRGRVPPRDVGHRPGHRGQRGVRSVVAEQERHHPVRHPQRPAPGWAARGPPAPPALR